MTRRRFLAGLLALLVYLFPAQAEAANKFWVGGTGALDGVDTTHISDSTGGAGGAVYPSASDTLIFDGASGGGTVTFTAAVTLAAIASGAHTGTIDTNGQTVTLSTAWNGSGTGTRTVTLGASAVSLQTWTFTTTTNLTFNAGTSVITVTASTAFQGGGLTYYGVVGNAAGFSMVGANQFTNLTRTGTAAKTNYFDIRANQTITGTFTVNGDSSINRMNVISDVKGTQRTITAATVSVTNADFQDIVGAGAGSWDLSAITGGSGDAGGNSGITFTTADANYWIGSDGSWSDSAHWSTSSGGAADGRVPLPQDTAIVDANSGTGTITQDMPRFPGVDFTGSASITWTTSTAASFFGSIDLTDLATLTASTQTYTYEGRGASTLTSAGKTWGKALTIDCVTGSLTLADALVLGVGASRILTQFSGGFSSSGYSVTILYFYSPNSTTRSLTMGASAWTTSSPNTAQWVMAATGMTLNAGTSTIRIAAALTSAQPFQGGGLTYYRLENATTGAFALQITGSNTFSDGIYVDASAAARTIQFTAGTTTTLGRLGRLDATTNVITIDSITAAGHTLTKSGGGRIGLDYMSISYSTAGPASKWYAGANSTDGGNNSGWVFTAPPTKGIVIQ